tara:strand:- start:281 stop:547 length:267 start_codon:yes stop_codon:yes gene_type:complete
MSFSCVLCNGNHEEYLFTSKFCSKCKKIKNYLSIYNERVYEVLDSVLARTQEKQQIKIADEIKKEIEVKQYNLRCKKVKKYAEPLPNL